MFLFKPDLTDADFSDNFYNADENITYTTSVAGFYYIDAYCFSRGSATSHNYQMLIYPNDATPDSFEPNDSTSTATTISNNTPVNGTINITTDDDWYVIDTTKTGKLAVSLENIPSGCDYDISIYDKNSSYLGGSYISSNTKEKANVLINDTGKYYIRVYSYSGTNSSSSYSLNAVVSNPDSYETNDYSYEAKNVNVGTSVLGTIDNIRDQDWYKVTIDETVNYIFELENIPSGRDYDMYIYNENGNYVAGSASGSNCDELVNTQLTVGVYYVKVYPYSSYSDTQNYTFSVYKDSAVNISLPYMRANAGDEIVVPVYIENVPQEGISCFDFKVKYDTNALSFTGYEAGALTAASTVIIGANQTSNGINVLYLDNSTTFSNPITTAGEVIKLKFTVNYTTTDGAYELKYNDGWGIGKLINGVPDDISNVVFKPGILIVGSYGISSLQTSSNPKALLGLLANGIVGDVNADGARNSIDFAYMRSRLLGKISDFPADNDLVASDLNLDQKFNSIDFAYMRMYLLGLIKELPVTSGTPTPSSSVTPTQTATPTPTGLVPPTDLQVSSWTINTISLTWTAPANTSIIVGYEIMRDGQKVGMTTGTTYTDTNLTIDTKYTYTVRTCGLNNAVSLECAPIQGATTDIEPPTQPTVNVTGTSGSSITLGWEPSTDNVGVTGYSIYNGNEFLGNTLDTTYTIQGLESLKEYTLKVTAFDAKGNKSEGTVKAAIDLVLSEDMTMSNDLYMNAGTIDLNGYKLIVGGNLIQAGGIVYVNTGSLHVEGDYRIQETSGANSSGTLKMYSSSDYIFVNGNFIMQSSKDHTAYLTKGILEVKGSFAQKSGNALNFNASGYHKVLLSGDSIDNQTVTFDNLGSSAINILQVRYPIEFYDFIDNSSSTFSVMSTTSDINIMSDNTTEGPFYKECIEEYKKDIERGTSGVNTATGDYSYKINSMTVKVPGFDLQIGATYNSQEKETKMLKKGWTFSLEGWIDIEDFGSRGKLLKVMLPGGGIDYFTYENGTYNTKGTRDEIILDSNGIYVITTKDKRKYGYENYETNKYRIKYMDDRYGNRVNFSYNSTSKKLTNIVDAMGNKVRIDYLTNKINITDEKSSRTVSYNCEGDFIKQILNPMLIGMSFNYDGNGLLNEVRDGKSNLIESVVYKAGTAEKYRVDTHTDSLGNSKQYSYFDVENGLKAVVREVEVNYTQVVTGEWFTAALKEDGTVVAWGDNSNGECNVPEGLTGVKSIVASDNHVVALKEDGTVVAWGDNRLEKCNVPEGLSGVIAVAAGDLNTAALKEDGTVVVWGNNWYGQCDVPAGLDGVKAIEAEVRYIVALKEDGTVVAWGRIDDDVKSVLQGLSGVKAISVGYMHSAALKEDGTVVAWGSNTYGECDVPAGLNRVKAIDAGTFRTVALKEDGTVIEWGDSCNVPEGLSGVKAISANLQTIALKEDGTIVLWGSNSTTSCNVPGTLAGFKSIAARYDFTLALKEDETVIAWGSDYYQSDIPEGLGKVKAIDVGGEMYYSFSVAIKEDGTVVTWGYYDHNVCNVPEGLSGVKAIAAGEAHIVVLKDDGTVVAWGKNDNGECNVPEGLTHVKAIAVGGHFSVALKEDGTVVAWGDNWYGQCNVPEGLSEVEAIAAGEAHVVVLKDDGTLVAWGMNDAGECNIPEGLANVKAISAGIATVALKEDGTVVVWGDESNQYVVPIGLRGVKTIDAGINHIVAITENGTLVSWGDIYNVPDFDTKNNTRTTTYLHKNYRVTEVIDTEGKTATYEYNDFGELMSTTDRNGNTTIYDINSGTGNITKVTNPDKSFKRFGYDSKNNLIWELDEVGNFVRYVYDSNGINLLKVAKYIAGKVNVDSLESNLPVLSGNEDKYAITEYMPYTTTDLTACNYGYTIKLKGVVHKIKDPLGNITTYKHHEDGNIKEVIEPEDEDGISRSTRYTYNSMGLKENEISKENKTTHYGYNNNAQVVNVKKSDENGESTTVINYNELGFVKQTLYPKHISEILPEALAQQGYRYTYYPSGKVETVTDPENNTTKYYYDQYGNLKREVRQNGSAYLYDYDFLNRVTKKYFQDYENSSKVLLEEYVYSIEPVFNSDLNHNMTKISYIQHFNNNEKGETASYYDYAGRLIKQELPYFNTSNRPTIENKYYKNGNLEWSKDAREYKTYYSYGNYDTTIYDTIWRSAKCKDNITEYSYTRINYDKTGRKTAEIMGKEFSANRKAEELESFITKNYEYYNSGKLCMITLGSNLLSRYFYDGDWNLVEEWQYTDKAYKNTTLYQEYNHLGKPEKRVVLVEKESIEMKTTDKTLFYSDYVGGQVLKRNSLEDADYIGLVTTYSYDANGNIRTEEAPNGVVTTYHYDKMDRLKRTQQSGVDEYGASKEIVNQIIYNWEGKPVTTTDARENITINITTNIYNQRGLLEKVKNTVTIGGELTDIYSRFEYDRAGRLIAEVEPEFYDELKTPSQTENRVEYAYNVMGRLMTKKFVGVEKQIDVDNGYAWKEVPVSLVQKAYEYDFNGNVVKELDALAYEAASGDNVYDKIMNGIGTKYTYTPENNVDTVLDAETSKKNLTYSVKYEYDALGRKTGETRVKGFDVANKYETKTTFQYNDGGFIEYIFVDGEKIQSNTYDFLGNLKEQKDALSNTTSHQYNALNLVTQSIYPGDDYIDQNVVTAKYNVVGNLVYQKNSMNTVNLYAYDNQGRVLSQTTQKGEGENAEDKITTYVKYDLNGNKRFVKDGNTNETEYIYDELNRVVESRVDGVKTVSGRIVNHSTRYEYDLNGNNVSTTEVVEGESTVENTYTNIYDALNRLIEKKNPATEENPDGTIERLEYNHNNVQIRSYDALNHFTQFEYDSNNRLTTTKDALLHKTQQGYDLAGNVSYKIDGEDNKTKYLYNKRDQLVEVGVYDKNTLVNGQLKYIKLSSYTFDLNNNMLTQTDGNEHVTTYDYNAANLVCKKIAHGGRVEGQEDNPEKVETYKYYSDGSLKTKTDKNSVTETYNYDCHGRLKQKLTYGDNPSNVSYAYDGNGNTLTVTNSSEKIEREYDEINRVKTKTIKKIETNTESNIGQFQYEYDIIYYSANGINYIAETATDPKLHKTTKVYDRVGRLKYVKNGAVNLASYTEYKYKPNGNLASVTYPGGNLREVYEYKNNNLLQTLTNYKSSDEVLDTYTYEYDNANNQTKKIEELSGIEKTTEYEYDYLNRLKKVTEPNSKTTEYEYDGAGNRNKETITITSTDLTISTYSYNEQNWLNKITTEDENGTVIGTVDYNYDNNGNQKGVKQNGTLITEYTYDDANQLITSSIKNDSTWKTVNYKYNGEGLRVSKIDGSYSTRYLYEYDKVVLEIESKSDQADKVNRNMYGTNLLMRTADGQSYFYMYNGHADVTALLDATDGSVDATYYYDAFGKIEYQKYYTASGEETTTPINNSIMYAGYQYDKETGLYYLNARMYDPKIARFLQEDTYTGDSSDPLSLNLYTYCSNNPVMYYDPTGHFGVFGMEFGNPVDGFKELFLTTEEEREQTFEIIRQYGGDDGYTNFVSNMGAGLAETGDLFKDPVNQMYENNKVLKSFITEDLGIKEDSSQYKALKYVGVRVESTGATTINIGKGIIGGIGLVGETLATDMEFGMVEGSRALGLFGLNDDFLYEQVHNEVYGNVNRIANQWLAVPGAIWSDMQTTFNGNNARNFFFNPDLSFQDALKYEQAAVNTGLIVVPAAKLANAGLKAEIAGIRNSAAALSDRMGLQPATIGGYGSNLLGNGALRKGINAAGTGWGSNILYSSGTGVGNKVNVELKFKEGWTEAQKAEAIQKCKALSEAKTIKTAPKRSGTSASSRYKKANGADSVPKGNDVDHTIDLQLGGADDILNMNPLDSSVNRSLGVQIKNAIEEHSIGTEFGEFTIK